MAPTQELDFDCGDYVCPPEETIFPERIIDVLAAFAERNRPAVEDQYVEELIPINPYENGPIPHLPNLHDILREASGGDDLENVSEVKLKVIAHEVGLQHLSSHLPLLRELTLDGSVVGSLRDLGSGLKMLKVLRVNRCGLTSLDGIYGMRSLSELFAENNYITDLTPCTTLESIRLINVRKNHLKNINSLSFLSVSETLRHLILEDNRNLTELADYRSKVKRLLPKLKSLDGVDYLEEDGDSNASCSSELQPARSHQRENRTISRNVSLPPIQTPKTSRASVRNKSENNPIGDVVAPECSSASSNVDAQPTKCRLPSRRDSHSSSGSSTSSRISSARDSNTNSSSSANCSYSVSFSPRVLTPRVEGGSADSGVSASDIKVHKVELPKI